MRFGSRGSCGTIAGSKDKTPIRVILAQVAASAEQSGTGTTRQPQQRGTPVQAMNKCKV
jgi:hypothetical protein